jgi:hypothetical protein
MWYWDLIPLALQMIGLPGIFTFKVYHDVYPSRIHQPTVHHFFGMALSLWLLTVGPQTFFAS